MFKLVIQDDEGKTTVVPLVRDEITIGRKEGNTIRLTERNVSRRHARIIRQGDTVELEDLTSYNGVRVNGMRIVEKVALAVSDRVQIGDYLIELKSDALATGSANDGAPTQQMHAIGGQTPAMGGVLSVANTAPVTAVRPPDEALAADSSQFVRDELDAAETTPVAAKPTAQYARLVVVSTQFAGEEHPLSRAQSIIGRGDESDIYVDHQSLSRNHARIVRELDTGNYFIEDLDSANGVRINGTEQQRALLRRGDVIDLGDLKLRFVEADEAFSFSPDLTMPETEGGGGSSSKTTWLVLGAVVLAGVVGWKLVSREKTVAKERAVVDAAPVVVPDARIPDAALPDAPPSLPVEPATNPATSQFLVAAGNGQFAEAFALYKRHIREADFAAATAEAFAELERSYSAAVVAQTKELVAAKQCGQIEKLADEAEKQLASAGAAVRAIGASCKEDVVAVAKKPDKPEKPDQPTKPVTTPPKDPKPTTTPATKDGEPQTAAEALTIARDAAFNGFHAKAARYATTALQLDPGNVDALQILVLSNCKMGKADAAKRYAAKLPASSQSAVRQVCLSQGISLD